MLHIAGSGFATSAQNGRAFSTFFNAATAIICEGECAHEPNKLGGSTQGGVWGGGGGGALLRGLR